MNQNSKILILGTTGLVGSAIKRNLIDYPNLLCPSKLELNLLDQNKIDNYFEIHKPDYVFLCAAMVGGIVYNSKFPVEFFHNNIQIGLNVLKCSWKYNVKKLVNLGSTCIYPKNCQQPIKEEYLMEGKLEASNEGYALAKIGILKLCEFYKKEYGCNFISIMPTNLYGPNDNYHLEHSHVLPAIIRKVHEAKIQNKKFIEVWGDGSPIREFMYVDDAADAIIFLAKNYNEVSHINIGTGIGISIKECYLTIMKILGYNGELCFDTTKPNGTMLKISDISKLTSLGWTSKYSFEEGIKNTYEHLRQNNFKWKER